MDDIETLRAKVIALGKANDDRQELLESISGKNKELKDALDAAKAIGEKAIRDRDKALEDLAQMKSTLSDTQQTLRAVQEDRDEFAAKMNDAVERAEQLQARCSGLEHQRGEAEKLCKLLSEDISEKADMIKDLSKKYELASIELDGAKKESSRLSKDNKFLAGQVEAFRSVSSIGGEAERDLAD